MSVETSPEASTIENLFNIDEPDTYRCNVFRYHSGLSRLYIRVFKDMADAPNFYLFFSDVGYIEGPMNWQGVSFERAPAEECLDLMVKVGMVADFMLTDQETRDALADAARLYKVKTGGEAIVRIIAGDAVKMADIPDDLK